MNLTATEDSTPPARAAGAAVDAAPFAHRRRGVVGSGRTATGAYAGAIEPLGLIVTRYALTPPGWTAGRKLSVTVIADLHAGGPDMTLPHIRRVVDTANALQSDLIVLLGDFKAWYRFKTEPVADADWAAELARLKAPLGIWAILGNHDWWHDLAGVRTALAECADTGARKRCGVARRGGPAVLARRHRRSDSPIGSAPADFAASTICRERWRRSTPTIRCCCWFTSRIFFRKCRSVLR